MSSLARGRGLEGLEIWLAGLFSAADMAAAQLLLQLSVAGAGESDEAADSSSSATAYSSPRLASPCLEDVTAEEEVEVKERVVEKTALAMQSAEERVVEEPAESTDLDRRARKRYRRLSELYAATSPVISDSDSDASAAKKLKRKRHHRDDGFGTSSPSSESQSAETTRESEKPPSLLEGLLRN